MLQYTICKVNERMSTGQGTKDLVKLVNQAIAEGWKPLGGVTISSSWKNSVVYIQAMVKEV